MNINDEDKIVKIIKDNVEKKDIKLSSRQILARFEREKASQKVKRPFYAFPSFKVALSFVTTSLVIGIFVYLNRDVVVPPITSTSDSGSQIISTSEVPPTSLELEPSRIVETKEDEFVFLSLTATAYVPDNNVDLTLMSYKGQGGNNSDVSIDEISSVLDQAMPLIDDFYQIDDNFSYQRNEGVFVGEFGEYNHQYIINEHTQIIANVDFEEDEEEQETEIEGEIIISGNHYYYEGETEIDLEDDEQDFKLKIEYSDENYLEIESENQGQIQKFKYKLVEFGDTNFEIEIETFRHGISERRYTKVDVKLIEDDYEFVVYLEDYNYIVEYKGQFIIVSKEDDDYIYTF